MHLFLNFSQFTLPSPDPSLTWAASMQADIDCPERLKVTPRGQECTERSRLPGNVGPCCAKLNGLVYLVLWSDNKNGNAVQSICNRVVMYTALIFKEASYKCTVLSITEPNSLSWLFSGSNRFLNL